MPLHQQLAAARALTDNPGVAAKLDVIDATLSAALEHPGASTRFLDSDDLTSLGPAGAAHASAAVFAGGAELRPLGSCSAAWVVVSLDRLTSDVDCSVGTTVIDAGDLPAVTRLEAWLCESSAATL